MNNATADVTLLQTKLGPQRTRVRLVDRPRLVSKLGSGDKPPRLTLVSAPAGYGKSTLLAQYVSHSGPLLPAWYSLDEGDNNIDVFTQYFLAAYDNALAEDAAHLAADKYQKSPNANPRGRLSLLFNRIAGDHAQVCFVLDDFHLITDSRVLELVEWILKAMPPTMTMILASRERPPLACLTELAAQGDLIELSGKQLRFTLQEMETFLSADSSIRLDAESIHTLYNRTEGWVAATQLALHALHDQKDPKEFIDHFSGTDKDIVSYLGAMVLSRQTPDIQNFFLRTSVLHRLNAELCAEVAGIPDSEAILEQLSNEGLFVFELDRKRQWFRYHHLFGEFLLSEFRSREPGRHRDLSLKAANWFAGRGNLHEAIDYYLQAEEFETAVKHIVADVSRIVQYEGNHEVLLRWVEKLPQRYLRAEPKLAICYAWTLIFTRNLDQVEAVLRQLHADHLPAEDAGDGDRQYDWIRWNIDMLDATHDVMCGKVLSARDKTERWLNVWPDGPLFEKGVVLGVNGAACIQTLDFKAARRVLRDGKIALGDSEAEYGVTWTSFLYALVLIRQGQIRESKHLLKTSLQGANRIMGSHSLASALLKLGLAYACYETNDLEEAAEYLDKSFFSIEEHGLVDTAHIAFLTKSRLLLREGRAAESMTVLYDAEGFGQRLHLFHYGTTIVVERIRRLILDRKTGDARELFAEYGFPDADTDTDRFTPYESLLLKALSARLCLADGDCGQAVSRTTELMEYCLRKGLILEYVRLAIVQIRACYDSGNTNKALRLLNKLIAMVAEEALVSVFVEESVYLEPLWPEFLEGYGDTGRDDGEAPEREFVKSLVSVLGLKPAPRTGPATGDNNASVMVEQLSRKEREILKYLGQGLSNQELAGTLFVSVSTIKWHLTHIYAKLGVKSRLEAIRTYQMGG